MKELDITEYSIIDRFHLTLAVVADLHGDPFDRIQDAFTTRPPDVICIPGDLCPFITAGHNEDKFRHQNNHAMAFLRYAVTVAPVYYSRGNNEKGWQITAFSELIRLGVHVLENTWEEIIPGLAIGGLASGFAPRFRLPSPPKTEWLSEYETYNGYKILLSHHPEYYKPYIQKRDINLVISGHAHGGQIRVKNQGFFAPGQGFFPKLTSGLYDHRMIISRGISRKPWIAPSFGNPPELVYIKL